MDGKAFFCHTKFYKIYFCFAENSPDESLISTFRVTLNDVPCCVIVSLIFTSISRQKLLNFPL